MSRLFHSRGACGGSFLQPLQFLEVAKPNDRPAAGTHLCARADETIFQSPEFRFAWRKIIEAGAANFPGHELIIPAYRAHLTRFIYIPRAMENLHDRIQVLLPKSG